MNYRIFALLLTLVSFCPCFAEGEEDNVVNVIAFFSKNDTTKYRETHVTYEIQGNDTIVKGGYAEDFMLVVRDSTATDYTIECTSTDFELLLMEPGISDKFTKLCWDVTKKVPMILKVDSLGALKEVVNWKEIRDVCQPAFKVACDMIKNEIDENIISIPGMIAMFNNLTNTEENIRKTTSISKMFSIYGFSFALGNNKDTSETLGHPTDVTFDVSVTESNSKEDEELAYEGDYMIKTISVTKMPTTELVNIGLDLSKQTTTSIGSENIDKNKQAIDEAAKGFGDATITVNEFYSYFYNGWPKYIGEEKIVDFNAAKIITTSEIEWINFRWQ